MEWGTLTRFALSELARREVMIMMPDPLSKRTRACCCWAPAVTVAMEVTGMYARNRCSCADPRWNNTCELSSLALVVEKALGDEFR